MSFSHMTTGSSWQEFQIIYLIAEKWMAGVLKVPDFLFVHPSEASGILDDSRSPFKTSEEAQFDIELTGTICPWTGRLKKQTNKKKRNFAVHILYNGTSQASGAFSLSWSEPPVLVRRDRHVSLAGFMRFMNFPRSESTCVYVCTFLLYPYTTGDAVSDWGRTVVPKT